MDEPGHGNAATKGLAHFIITKFCLRGGKWMDPVDGPWFSAVNPLKARNVNLRLKLLETICLPGLLAQTNRNFTWVLLVDADLDRCAKGRLKELAGNLDRAWLHEYRADSPVRLERLGWLGRLMDRPDFVVTTQNDDDDALPRRFVETVQSHIAELQGAGRMPPYKVMANKSALQWHMAFTRNAPLGWASPWRRPKGVPACGFSLACRHPAFDFSVLGMRHLYAESYFDFEARPPARNVAIYRRMFSEAARDARVGRIPMNAAAFFDSSAAGAALIGNHGGNARGWRVPSTAVSNRCLVRGAETFPDVGIDWGSAQRHARHFGGWRLWMRRAESALYGPKGTRITALRRFMKPMQRLRKHLGSPSGVRAGPQRHADGQLRSSANRGPSANPQAANPAGQRSRAD